MIDDHRFVGEEIPVSNGSARPPAIGSGPIERSSMVRAVLPCENCSHRDVCAIRPLLDPAELQYRTPPSPHEAIRISLVAAITCAHYSLDPTVVEEAAQAPFVPQLRPEEARRAAKNGAAGRQAAVAKRQARQARIDAELAGKPPAAKVSRDPAPPDETREEWEARIAATEQRVVEARASLAAHHQTAVQPAPAKRRGRPPSTTLTRRQSDLIGFLLAHGGDRPAAAREFGIVNQSVDSTIDQVGKKGLLPAELLAMLPARFAKWARVAS